MPISAEQRRLERLLRRQSRFVQARFINFVQLVSSARVINQASQLLEAGQIDDALTLVDTYVIGLGTDLLEAFVDAAQFEVGETRRKITNSAVSLSFDPSHPRAAELMRRNRLQFIRDFSREQRRATTRALSRALAAGVGPREAARAFRDSIGLTERQEAAVENYRRLLRLGSNEALTRELRDRRFDRTVRRASVSEPLTPRQVNLMVDRYRARALALRAETIARTESVRISSIARQEGFAQSLEDAGLSSRDVIRVWNATGDERTRDSHVDMDGQEVAVGEPFITGDGFRIMFPGDPSAPPGETINCRCVVTHELRAA